LAARTILGKPKFEKKIAISGWGKVGEVNPATNILVLTKNPLARCYLLF